MVRIAASKKLSTATAEEKIDVVEYTEATNTDSAATNKTPKGQRRYYVIFKKVHSTMSQTRMDLRNVSTTKLQRKLQPWKYFVPKMKITIILISW